mgnify:CR=1 FL=1
MFADMPASSVTPAERSRKMVSVVLQALQEPGRQVAAAAAMGASESTVSRLKNEHLENLTLLLAHIGLKIVPIDYVCVDKQTYESVAHLATRAMSRPEIAKQLIWDEK